MYKRRAITAMSIVSSIVSAIVIVILIGILVLVYQVYKGQYFNGFIKAANNQAVTTFTRDNKITDGVYKYSYKIDSKDFNDAMFYKEITVKPNTPYKVTCMVKTQDVATVSGKADAGAQIGIEGTTECSDSIIGTNDWQELDFMFNSKNRTTIQVGFRLGGNIEQSKGTVWFSDFKLEQGLASTNKNWNMALFIFKNVDVTIDNNGYLVLYSCNAGHLGAYYFGGENIGSAFSKIVSGNVIAFDGNVGFGTGGILNYFTGNWNPRLSNDQNSFYQYNKDYSKDKLFWNRSPMGPLTYRNGKLVPPGPVFKPAPSWAVAK